jgi:formylglycine-generating enzyme required for sulfatase activity
MLKTFAPHRFHTLLLRGAASLSAGAVLMGCRPADADGAVPPTEAGPARPSQTAEIVNDVGMSFVHIPTGTFFMGAAEDEAGARADEHPRRQVEITRTFQLGRYEVTQAQWQAVMGASPYALDRSNPYYNLPGMAARITRPDHPATVSWNDAQTFIARLNAMEDGGRYRLPTEAEWEYAARAGTTTAYSFGDERALLGRYAWYGEDFASGGTHPVGSKAPNPWGLYDVHGNVWEWVEDRYAADAYVEAAGADPQGPETEERRVVRGGSWHVTAGDWRSAYRKAYAPDYRGISIGFRLVREPVIAPP